MPEPCGSLCSAQCSFQNEPNRETVNPAHFLRQHAVVFRPFLYTRRAAGAHCSDWRSKEELNTSSEAHSEASHHKLPSPPPTIVSTFLFTSSTSLRLRSMRKVWRTRVKAQTYGRTISICQASALLQESRSRDLERRATWRQVPCSFEWLRSHGNTLQSWNKDWLRQNSKQAKHRLKDLLLTRFLTV